MEGEGGTWLLNCLQARQKKLTCAFYISGIDQDHIYTMSRFQHKGVFNVSSLSTREGSDRSSNAPRRRYSDQSEKKSEFVSKGPSKLAKQPNNRKIVAHIINPRYYHAIRPCH